eukprot:CAMPEP_0119551602 /NCGR_PEP_ID=MMETSP1352-20130426/4812_1 /TAXON_ID=265584 /ORGANISM="Stauroneis constricta, Strain CCMP1120" /LENGTH=73 /DNA_ID=CAMNT_0007597687 /DNA_START=483 /DNA_END=704 /DNA_ORIENTATION=-
MTGWGHYSQAYFAHAKPLSLERVLETIAVTSTTGASMNQPRALATASATKTAEDLRYEEDMKWIREWEESYLD